MLQTQLLEVNTMNRRNKTHTRHLQHVNTSAHTDLHVPEIWNGHNSHFRDVTPERGTDRRPINTQLHSDSVQTHSLIADGIS